jgi:hypothetical protein
VSNESKGWIGVDLDGTLAMYTGWQGADHIGAPVPPMVERVRQWRAQGIEVRIFTARVYKMDDEAKRIANIIGAWCEAHIGEWLPITARKDYAMIELWDDRAVRVIANTGIRADDFTARLERLEALEASR